MHHPPVNDHNINIDRRKQKMSKMKLVYGVGTVDLKLWTTTYGKISSQYLPACNYEIKLFQFIME